MPQSFYCTALCRGRLRCLSILVGLTALALGCNSISSQLLERDVTNTAWNSEGRMKGIPITLKVPTHLKLYVYDVHFLEYVNNDLNNTVQPVNLDVPVRDFASEFMYTDKIFTVDFKRPAAGPFNLRLTMSDQQYFTEIKHDVTDETIAKVSGLINSLFVNGKMFEAAGRTLGQVPIVSEVKSLVAVGLFEIDNPNFQTEVCAFLNCHLNKAHDAWVAPPGVDYVNRVGIPPGENLNVPYPAVPFCPGGDCGCPPTGPQPTPAPWGTPFPGTHVIPGPTGETIPSGSPSSHAPLGTSPRAF